MNEKYLESRLDNFLKKFPNNAKSWSMATDEIRELARYIRIYYNLCILNVDEDSEDGLNPIDFRAIKTPSEWNTKGKNFIKKYWKDLPIFVKEDIDKYLVS